MKVSPDPMTLSSSLVYPHYGVNYSTNHILARHAPAFASGLYWVQQGFTKSRLTVGNLPPPLTLERLLSPSSKHSHRGKHCSVSPNSISTMLSEILVVTTNLYYSYLTFLNPTLVVNDYNFPFFGKGWYSMNDETFRVKQSNCTGADLFPLSLQLLSPFFPLLPPPPHPLSFPVFGNGKQTFDT